MFRRRVFKVGDIWRWILYVSYGKYPTKIESGAELTREKALEQLKLAVKRYKISDKKVDGCNNKYRYRINYLKDGIKSHKEFGSKDVIEAIDFMSSVDGQLSIYETI